MNITRKAIGNVAIAVIVIVVAVCVLVGTITHHSTSTPQPSMAQFEYHLGYTSGQLLAISGSVKGTAADRALHPTHPTSAPWSTPTTACQSENTKTTASYERGCVAGLLHTWNKA
jgi:hypothetical protein